MTTDPHLDSRCHLCGASELDEFNEFRAFHRVSSDCKPWPAGGRLCRCRACGSVQKVIDDVWRREVDGIYSSYAIYDQAEGVEQAVFDEVGTPCPRSERLLHSLCAEVTLPSHGRMLDIGCGNGAMLRAFSRIAPGWSLAGTELNDKYRRIVESIKNVEPLYACLPAQVPGLFDVVTLIHVLEHIVEPDSFLADVLAKMVPGGLLVVQLPYHVENPFELLIVDHCTHFAAATATALLERVGFEVLRVADDWVPKELTVIAKKPLGFQQPPETRAAPRIAQRPETALPPHEFLARRLHWLAAIATTARQLAAAQDLGVFGTSIAGSWLFAELEGKVSFFVDEDPNRIGKTWLGRPTHHPAQIPTGSEVFIPLPSHLADTIFRRNARADVRFHCPPSM